MIKPKIIFVIAILALFIAFAAYNLAETGTPGTNGLNKTDYYNASIDILNLNSSKVNKTELISIGNYTGDGTTNRFIPYSLNRTASTITIIGNSSVSPIGHVIYPGYIYNIDGSRLSVNPQNTSGFFVSGLYNQIQTLPVTYIQGGFSSSSSGQEGIIRYQPFTTPTYDSASITVGLNLTNAVGNYRMAIYNASGGSPSVLLNQTGSNAVIAGWNNQSLIVPLTANTQYWIAFQLSSTSTIVNYVASGTTKYHVYAYNTFPNTPSALSTTNTALFYLEYMLQAIGGMSYDWVAQ